MARRADLAHQQDVQWRAQRSGNLVADGHAASGQGEHYRMLPRALPQHGCQRLAGVMAIPEGGGVVHLRLRTGRCPPRDSVRHLLGRATG